MEHLQGSERAAEDGLLLPGEELSSSRRNFLRLAGFGVASSALGACSRGPVQKVVPLLAASEVLVPGRGYAIATTCAGCSAACGVLARCRDGRPIHLQGNPDHGLSRGGLCAVGQADLLELYDSKRAAAPLVRGVNCPWDAALAELRRAIDTARAGGKAVRVLTGTLTSPSTRRALGDLLAPLADARLVEQDSSSCSAWLDACGATHGVRALPRVLLERARVIVAFEADFLGTWFAPVEHAAAYAAGRIPDDGRISRHVHCESHVSLTGLAADERHVVAPWQVRELLRLVCAALEVDVGATPSRVGGSEGESELARLARTLADELRPAGKFGLVLYGGNDEPSARLCNYANALLGAWGETLTLARPSLQRRGDDRAVAELWSELEAGRVGVLLCASANPAYEWPRERRALLERVDLLAVHSAGLDETWSLADVALPAAHALESWDDAEPHVGRFALTQPTVPPLRDARTLRWVARTLAGAARPDAQLLREHWRDELHARIAPDQDFEAFWRRALHDGWVEDPARVEAEPPFEHGSLAAFEPQSPPDGLALVLYTKVGLQAGAHAHNPWLQELPDPVTKVVWDNYACLAPDLARELGVETGDRVRVSAEGVGTLELPALVQRGQHERVVAIALGYGRAGTERFAAVGPQWWEARATVDQHGRVGVNAADLLTAREGHLRGDVLAVRVERSPGRRELAVTQEHHSLVVPEHLAPARGKVRDAARTVTLASLGHAGGHGVAHAGQTELWQEDHAPTGHHWGLAIDLSRCTGCSACVIGCQSENNIPVVGRDEVLRHREMHWMRIDRYYEDGEHGLTAVHQPMMCQQCDHAPCESVCPVLATVHSSEGLNQQVYNRCVGTRYCANTCPYKVRRFNWFDYQRADALQNQALNPDVTVRTRGVMEKCSFCSQRIIEAKARARSEGRALVDGDIVPACQQSCPTQAIVFGDMNDAAGRLRRRMEDPRAYVVLGELNVQPSVRYLERVVSRPAEELKHG